VTPDLLEGENAYKCVKCGTKGTAAKGTKIVALPPMLTLTLKRFDLNYQV
jgi:ubiquitin C-terminal hydrolase